MVESLKEYLKHNHNKLDIKGNGSFSNMTILDDDLKNKDIFLTGENHGIKANAELRMAFLDYFKRKVNFKYYLCELPFSASYFLNIYLKTGDENLLNMVYENLKGTDAYNEDDYRHWKTVYRYNKDLPQDDRIMVIGMDIEHQTQNALSFMEYCIGERNIPDKIKKIIDNLRDFSGSDRDIKEFSLDLGQAIDNNRQEFEELLGKDYEQFKHVNRNILNMYEVYNGDSFNSIRDNKMFQNFTFLHSILPEGKYYGQLGLSHIFQRAFPLVRWFGAALNNKESEFKDRIISIAYVYDNCRYLYPTIRKNYTSTINTLDTEMDVFNELADGRYTIFKLNGHNSPFSRELIWPIAHKLSEGGSTTDYFQYLVIIRNSKAMEPFIIEYN